MAALHLTHWPPMQEQKEMTVHFIYCHCNVLYCTAYTGTSSWTGRTGEEGLINNALYGIGPEYCPRLKCTGL